ncbi:hypothetical protein ebA351 [Aromatoleum aromaticum EbN1]|uniref:Secreted protein n=1 Tax=Aromatoleum aromaticum (strain DSM 19018 / LMG 30748 / EbN1) TaxID=76114 RepID=Q5P8Q3_AROAE|nr:hypothetical protein ebA351 [Aromatoleum aromaticum EbN1]
MVKLARAAPASFFSVAATSQAACASREHFFMKLALAAPDSFFSADRALHEPSSAWVATLTSAIRRARINARIYISAGGSITPIAQPRYPIIMTSSS